MIARIKSPLRAFYHELKLINLTGRNSFLRRRDSQVLVVHFDSFIMNADMGRFLFIFCQYLKFCGFRLIIKIDTAFVGQLAPPYKRLFLKQNHTLVRSCSAGLNTVEWLRDDGTRKIIRISYGYQHIGAHNPKAFYLPFPLHPKFYKKRISPQDLTSLRNQHRKTLIFFAGNSDVLLYDKDVLQTNFPGTISRLKALDFIQTRFGGTDKMELVTETARLYNLLDNEGSPIILSEARTPTGDWLKILGKTHFFLCLPGVRMPWSHNAIESMSVGTIPIIQYGSLFTPPLEHMKNAVCYSDHHDLGEVIDMIMQLPQCEVERLRANVMNYYDQYLSTDHVVSRISEFFSSGEDILEMVMPYLEDPEK